ncbi:MAG: cytochrome c [Gammaproteobacteria bacterium]|nr:cytochrome c [Gammaproteobacteria bacterium]MBU0788565.1 cytochrome c [Gammaproteobacteria bacterium]MBU0815611.1 cytochrome c [Gammaproteobacteria bacterium]MBU1788181.1 cytochrome c [Gammaproteobacteria bacterium]
MLKKRLLLSALWMLALSGALLEPALAGDVAAGRAKAQTLCLHCHGVDGVAVLPGAANLSGQQQDYLREQLRAYRSGGRQSPHMSVVAKMLTDADIENLAAWYSSIKVSVEMPK